jgi:hypothetical protein
MQPAADPFRQPCFQSPGFRHPLSPMSPNTAGISGGPALALGFSRCLAAPQVYGSNVVASGPSHVPQEAPIPGPASGANSYGKFARPAVMEATLLAEGRQEVKIGCPQPRLDGAKNPAFRRAESPLDEAAFQVLEQGSLPLRCPRCVVVKDHARTTWCTQNLRTLAAGGFHLPQCPFCGDDLCDDMEKLRAELKLAHEGQQQLLSQVTKASRLAK